MSGPASLQTWRLDGKQHTLVLASFKSGIPEIIYWAGRLPTSENLDMLARHSRPDVTGGMIDVPPPISMCPTTQNGFDGHPGIIVSDGAGGWVHPEFELIEAEQNSEASHLRFTCRDAQTEWIYIAEFWRQTDDVLSSQARLIQPAKTMRQLVWLSAPVLPGPAQAHHIIEYSGRWCGELQTERSVWRRGQRRRDNPTGRSGHEHFPSVLLLSEGAGNTSGEVWALHCGASSGHSHIIEECADGRRQVQMGFTPFGQHHLQAEFTSPMLYFSYSARGLNGCGASFQHFVRDRLVEWPQRKSGKRPTYRPVHYNCWEAVYFDHELDSLKEIASRAADLGAERFILDDGWFGRRDDDTSSLGDWVVNDQKYPDGLSPLIEHVKSLDMEFGLWFEPEMVNADSDFFRQYPNAALGPRTQTLGRHQMVLDLTQRVVCDMIITRLTDLLSCYAIDYIKWDHNRVLPYPDHRQAQALHQILAQLRTSFPNVEIESCASGGGRMDYGMLAHTHRLWLSDSNDALERVRIQHESALWLPACVAGSHVGPETCHTSGRVISLGMRAWVAAQRHMGFEMDVRDLSETDAELLATVTSWWKQNRDWMLAGTILRLDSRDKSIVAELQLSAEKDKFVTFIASISSSPQTSPKPLRLTGLEPDAHYQLTLVNKEDIHHLSRGNPLLKSEPLQASGRYLMDYGLILPWSLAEHIWVIEGTRI